MDRGVNSRLADKKIMVNDGDVVFSELDVFRV